MNWIVVKALGNMAIATLGLLVLAACDRGASRVILGSLERDRIVISAAVGEVITDIAVKEGQSVKRGQLMMQLDERLQMTHVEQALANRAQAQARVEELYNGAQIEEIEGLRAQLDGAEAKLKEIEHQFQRMHALYREKAVSEANMERVEAQRDSAMAERDELLKRWQLLIKGTRVEQLAQGEAQLSAAKSMLQAEQKRLSDYQLIAPVDATVEDIPWLEGERILAGQSAIVLSAVSLPFARVYVPQTLRAKMTINDEVNVHVEGYGSPFSGRIRFIETQPAFTPFYALNQKERSRLMFLTEIALAEDARDLPAGLSVEVVLP